MNQPIRSKPSLRALPGRLAGLLAGALFAGVLAAQGGAGDPLRDLERCLGADVPQAEFEAAIGRLADAVGTGRVKANKAARVLVALLEKPVGARVEGALVSALVRVNDEVAVRALIERSVHSDDSTVRRAAWDGLVKSPGSATEPTLVAALGAKPWELRAQVALALCQRGAFSAIDALIARLEPERDLAVQSALGEALERLTLKVLPVTHRAWSEWRAEHRTFSPYDRPAVPEPGSTGDSPEDPRATVVTPPGPQKPRAYGIVPMFEHFPVEGEVVLVVVDVSTSMQRNGAPTIEEARTLVKSLPTYVECMVMAFQEVLVYADEVFAPLDVHRKLALDSFLAGQKSSGGSTDLEIALLAAIDRADQWFESHPKDPRALDIVVFTDGRSQARGAVQRVSPDKVRSALERLTNRRVVRLSTIGSTGTVTPLMVDLALMSGGYVVLGDKPDRPGLLGR